VGIATRRKRLRTDQNDFKAATELIEQLGVVAFLLMDSSSPYVIDVVDGQPMPIASWSTPFEGGNVFRNI